MIGHVEYPNSIHPLTIEPDTPKECTCRYIIHGYKFPSGKELQIDKYRCDNTICPIHGAK